MKGEGLRAQLLRGGLGAGLIKLVGIAMSLVLSILLARLLGPEQFGLYSFIFALVSILAIPAQMGLPNLVIRETARAMVNQDNALIKGLWRWAGRMVVLSCIVLALLGGGASLVLKGYVPALTSPTFYWGLALMPLIAFGTLRGAAMRGLGVIVRGLLPEFILLPGLFIFLLSVAFIFVSPLDAATAMMLHVAAGAGAFLAGTFLLSWVRPGGHNDTTRYESATWRKAMLPLALIAGSGMITRYTDIVMLGLMRSEAEVGVYRIAAQWAWLTTLGLLTVNLVVPPQFARLHELDDRRRLQQLASKAALVATLLALPPFLAFMLFGEEIVTFLVGAEYAAAHLPLAILAGGQVINAITGSVGMLLAMTGFERDTARIVVASATLNIILNLMLIPAFGMVGAAIATAFALSAQMVTLWVILRARLKINSSMFHWQKI
ncbi:flippase [Thalassospira xianhensis]|nr:flippase [Thalassospira xianhensis]